MSERSKTPSYGAVVIENRHNDPMVLLCGGYHGWSFPKGHQEEGETPEQTAVREVKEETGISIQVDTSFTRTVGSALPGESSRTVTFFLGTCPDGMPEPSPQPEEVARAAWIPAAEAIRLIAYEPDREVLKDAFGCLNITYSDEYIPSDRPLLQECLDYVALKLGEELSQITLERVVMGVFYTGVKLSTGHGGLCYTPERQRSKGYCSPTPDTFMPHSGRLAGTNASVILAQVFESNQLKRALGIATLNALSTYIMEREAFGKHKRAGNVFDEIPILPASKTVVVGALVPAMRKLRDRGAEWTVLERNPRALKGDELKHYLPAERAPEVVPQADTLVIAGITLLNGTIEDILDMALPDALILITGPTASICAEPLFRRGISMIGGVTVTDADNALDMIAEGANIYQLYGRCAEQIIIRNPDKQPLCI